jgi:LPXTG-motif cell wall-anchored protein
VRIISRIKEKTMNTTVQRALWGTLLAGGITLFGATVANAAETTGDDGLLAGTQSVISLDVPVNVGATAISLLGDSSTTGADAAPAAPAAPAPAAATSGTDGVASGTQALIDVSVPVAVQDVAVSLIGDSNAAEAPASAPAAVPAPAAPAAATDGSDSVAGGTQVVAPITAPVTVDGVAVSVIGDSSTVRDGSAAGTPAATAPADADTSGEDSVLGGTEVVAPITLPVSVGDLAVSVIGDSSTTGGNTGGTPVSNAPTNPVTSGQDGLLGGTHLILPITVPITVGDTAVSVIGDSAVTPGATDPGTTDPGTTDPGTTDPGTTDPGTTDPGTTEPGTTDPGTTDPGTTDPGTTDPGTTDDGDTGATISTASTTTGTLARAAAQPMAVLAKTGGEATALLPLVGLLLVAGGAFLARRRLA